MTSTTRRTAAESNGSRSGVLGQVAESVADFSGTARRAIGDTAHKAADIASDFADEAVTRSKQAAKVVADEVREHPVRTLAIGAAVGVLIAAVLMRKR